MRPARQDWFRGLHQPVSLCVCKTAGIRQVHVFWADTRRGKTSVGWFDGFNLPLVVHDCGELIAFRLIPGNVEDCRPVLRLARRLMTIVVTIRRDGANHERRLRSDRVMSHHHC